MYNLEYRILDSLGRTKKIKWGGVYHDLDSLETGKKIILSANKKISLSFDVYFLDKFYTHTFNHVSENL